MVSQSKHGSTHSRSALPRIDTFLCRECQHDAFLESIQTGLSQSLCWCRHEEPSIRLRWSRTIRSYSAGLRLTGHRLFRCSRYIKPRRPGVSGGRECKDALAISASPVRGFCSYARDGSHSVAGVYSTTLLRTARAPLTTNTPSCQASADASGVSNWPADAPRPVSFRRLGVVSQVAVAKAFADQPHD